MALSQPIHCSAMALHEVRGRLSLCRGDTDGREGDTDDGVSEDDYTFAKYVSPFKNKPYSGHDELALKMYAMLLGASQVVVLSAQVHRVLHHSHEHATQHACGSAAALAQGRNKLEETCVLASQLSTLD